MTAFRQRTFGGLRGARGRASFTVGDATIEATAGRIVFVPAGVPHKFVNPGTEPLSQATIRPDGRVVQETV